MGNLFRCVAATSSNNNALIATGTINSGAVNVNCGFQPTAVFLAYGRTSSGSCLDFNIPEHKQGIHIHIGDDYNKNESIVTITPTGFTASRTVGGDEGEPLYWVAVKY